MFQVLLPSHEPHIRPTILMLVRALERCGIPCRESPLRRKPARALAKIAGWAGIRKLRFCRSRAPVFVQLNHSWANAFYPYVLRHRLVTYSFDVWPDTWDEWERVFRLNRPSIAFISAKAPLEEMKRRIPEVDFRWLPEAVDPSGFQPELLLRDRPIDVFEVGRPFASFHECIRPVLERAGLRHQYGRNSESASLPYSQVVETYGTSKVVICFPRSLTHPDSARGVETTTFRYFECMASRTLMFGHCPAELIDILGYNPVIEADPTHPGEQLASDVLPRINEFQALVDRNYSTIRSTWTVEHQARRIREALEEVSAFKPSPLAEIRQSDS